ncbi:hypothetical protein Ddye_027428 [Dipteronia dyeriana]|uniref:Uncharacterized protein n=1 Tax=Dipteronia dyeriana TaxID=168575 RepID=A0AAD9WRD8_9ROSI|nr:hypothetical protein Ddye_027428 [Dipteronia dyeriana]
MIDIMKQYPDDSRQVLNPLKVEMSVASSLKQMHVTDETDKSSASPQQTARELRVKKELAEERKNRQKLNLRIANEYKYLRKPWILSMLAKKTRRMYLQCLQYCGWEMSPLP